MVDCIHCGWIMTPGSVIMREPDGSYNCPTCKKRLPPGTEISQLLAMLDTDKISKEDLGNLADILKGSSAGVRDQMEAVLLGSIMLNLRKIKVCLEKEVK